MTLRKYIATQMGPTDPYTPADNIWYHFGDNDHAVRNAPTSRTAPDVDHCLACMADFPTVAYSPVQLQQAWADLFATYVRPPLLDAAVRGSISFGMGGSGSGVPFHTHGPVFAEVLHGLKVRRTAA